MKRTCAVVIAVAACLLPEAADAYSSRTHIHLANVLRDDLIRNWEKTDRPLLRVLGPADAPERFVELRRADAEAIRDFPEFFRAGAVGPDNTVLPALTDPSHTWMYRPFEQCRALLDASTRPEERAYALGCFIHGVSDNTAHHVVNFFTGETFTLFPTAAVQNGTPAFDLTNVVAHIVVESKLEGSLADADPQAFSAERMKHKTPIDLVHRVYYEDESGDHGLWRSLARHLVARKNAALRRANVPGFDPERHLAMTVAQLREHRVSFDIDARILIAYADFLATGGGVSMSPAEYVLFLPEIIADVKRLLTIAVINGENTTLATTAEWEAFGRCAFTCPVLRLRKMLYDHLFDPASNGGISRMQLVVDRKHAELDAIMVGFLESNDRLSNAIVIHGVENLPAADIAEVLEPLVVAIGKVGSFPYDLLFPKIFATLIDFFGPLQSFLEQAFALVAQEISRHIIARIESYLAQLGEAVRTMRDSALAAIGIRIEELREMLEARLDAALLTEIGLDLSQAADVLASFPDSVLYMNTINSMVGTLGNQLVVEPREVNDDFFAGPVSFDASYQLTFNQLALCDDLEQVFYPCGHTATEMLQPEIARCQRLDQVVIPDATVECHAGEIDAFVAAPGPDVCQRALLDELIADPIGSRSLAFPADLAEKPPICIDPPLVGINADEFGDDKADCGPGGDCSRGDDAAGCGCATSPGGRAGDLGLAVIAAAWLWIRRRRLSRT